MSLIEITKTEYQNYGKCIKLDNGICSLLVTVDVGPRVVFFALHGKENVFFEDLKRQHYWSGPEMDSYYGKGSVSYLYGGHRLWVSEESTPETTYPDNHPVDVEYTPKGVILRSVPEVENGVQKIMKIEMEPDKALVKVSHDVINISDKEKTFGPWALSVLAPGGVEIIPQPQRPTGLLSNRNLVLWSYTDMSDDRLFWGKEFTTLKQDENADVAIKIGLNLEDGYASYLNRGQVFTKRFTHKMDGQYPDHGCSFETYTKELFLELEALGEYKAVQPNNSIVHEETWELRACDEEFDRKNEASIKTFVEKYIK